MWRLPGWSLRLAGAVAAGYAAAAVVLFALYWGGGALVGEIPSDAAADWTIGATLVGTALIVLWMARPAPHVDEAAERSYGAPRRAAVGEGRLEPARADLPPRS